MFDDASRSGSAGDDPASPRPVHGSRTRTIASKGAGDRDRIAPEPRELRFVFALLSVLILASQAPGLLEAFGRSNVNGYGGVDYRLYVDATQRWLDGGAFYQPYQLAGTYSISAGDILYPPVALLLFVPFTILPAVLWWLLPVGLVAIVVSRLRPGPVAWPLMALCLAWPPTQVKLITGNPVMWSVAAVALGCLYRWPFVFVFLKPSLFPFAFFGAMYRSWWIALGAILLVSLPFGSMWVDWLRTVVDSRGGGIAYSVQEIPMLLLPLVAWRWRKRAA